MSSETKIDQLDTNITDAEGIAADNADTLAGSEETSPKRSQRSKKSGRITPLTVAAIIFILTLLFFGVWKCFFDTSIVGSWTFKINEAERKYTYNFTFEDDNVVRYHYGGRTFIGKYNFTENKPQVHIFISSLGMTFIDAYFDYSVTGNIFTGRELRLTDRTGLIFPPDEISEETDQSDLVKLKKKIAKSKEEDGIRYYTLPFENYSVDPEIKKYDNFKADSKLLGSWLYKDDETGYSYTFTFHKNGVMEQLSPEIAMTGGYQVKDGICTYNFIAAGGTTTDYSFDYTVDGKTLLINDEIKLTKTDNKYAYQTEIK